MIILNDINLSFGKQIIFNNISLNFNKDNRIGLVGRNGSGKSTLLKIIAGLEKADDGQVAIEKKATIGYMPQEVVLQSDKTIYQETFSTFPKIYKLLEKSKNLEERLSEQNPVIIEQYSQIQQDLLETNYQDAQIKTKKILTGLGFSQESFDKPVSTLSVGWRMRVVLAKLLLKKADFYLFDEPTNHLDIVTKDWFLNFLKDASFGFILVCHDRYFLDNLCTKILDLENGNAKFYNGNYSLYSAQKEQDIIAQEQAALRQQKDIAKKMKTIERFRASASKAKMAQSMLKKVENIERIETTRESKKIAFSFPPVARSGKVVLKVENVSHSFVNKKVFENVSFEVERGDKVAIVAPNGVGKTTLFNLITGKLQLQHGEKKFGYNVFPAFFEQDQDKVLNQNSTIFDEVESVCTDNETRSLVRKFLGAFLFSGDDVYKKIRVLSGGEKNRVAMVKVLLQQANLLLLDEPTNHLDIQSKEILLDALKQFKGTILFVSHDRDFLDRLGTRIIELSPNGAISYPGNYESYLYHKHKDKKEMINIKQKKVSGKKPQTKNDYENRKEINKIETKISKLEKKIEELNEALVKYEYGTKEFSYIYDKLLESQKKLKKNIEKWESLISTNQ